MLNFKKLTGALLVVFLSPMPVFAEVQPTFVTTVSTVMTDGMIEGIQNKLGNKLTPTQTTCLQNTANSKMIAAVNGFLLQAVSPTELQQINAFMATPTGKKFNHLMLDNLNDNNTSTDDFTDDDEAQLIAFSETSAYKKMFKSGEIKKLLHTKSADNAFSPIVVEKILTCDIL